MRSLWLPLAVAAVAVATAFTLSPPPNPHQDAKTFDRLARRVEGASTLSPAAHATMAKLLEGARTRSPSTATIDISDAKRRVAIERFGKALEAKAFVQQVSTEARAVRD